MKRGKNRINKKDSFLLGKETWERKIKNRRGLEMSINVIVIIVLAILLLIALVIILNRQTGFFSDFLNNLFGKTNVDNLVTSCNSLISQNAVYEYCCDGRDAKYRQAGKIVEEELTCQELADKNFTSGRINKLNCENVC